MAIVSMRKKLSKVNPNIIAGVDVGTSKVACCIGRIHPSGEIQVLGSGYHASRGLQGGAIVDMRALQRAIASAVHGAEEMAALTVNQIYLSFSPRLTVSSNISIEVPLAGHPVTENDLRKVLMQACQKTERSGYEIIHTVPTGYSVDLTKGIRDPLGMFGERLGGTVHLISGMSGPLRNLSVCVEHCHLNVANFVVSCLGSGLSTLVEDEMDLGVTLIDMGAGVTSVATFMEGKLVYMSSVGVGGMHVTNDIARGLSTPLAQAERIKALYGNAIHAPKEDREMIEIPQIGEESSEKGSTITKSELARIIQPRLEETFEMVRERLKDNEGTRRAIKRVVLTGGASQLAGVKELAAYILDKQIRLGKPMHVRGLSERAQKPDFSACVGLLMYARDELFTNAPSLPEKSLLKVGNLMGRVGSWLKENI